MANLQKIPPTYHNEILNMIGENMTTEAIREKLNTTYNTNFTSSSVYNTTRKLRQQYQELAKQKLSIGIAESATQDLHIMSSVITDLFIAFKAAIAGDELSNALQISNELNKWNARRISLSGIDNVDTTDKGIDHEAARDELVEQLSNASAIQVNIIK